ncbi:Ribose 5-phosphate isomerase [Spraguea lophii 42_110]|uniref:Ribose-5-phosphate isomerase n=1 Tax=Spraguea lophii (strain 42_110) TaxID=1358809 RepID=S7XRD2_SPRLO|nr:Ribose 5-phosphate isomerase [Spraguea lophii 42_110]
MYENIIENSSVIGLGTGNTLHKIIDSMDKKALKNKIFVSSSMDTLLFINSKDINASEIQAHSVIDIYLDGADYYNDDEIIKGMGGAIFYEKLLINMSNKNVIFVQVNKYRENFKGLKVPLEIMPAAVKYVEKQLTDKKIEYNLRYTDKKKGPLITDNGNCIIDIIFNKEFLEECKNINGILEHGYLKRKEHNIEIIEMTNN